ncbi:Bug family tripartite tricarboxylate transporter substrate binding protein [Cupriavidus consociatus]|uniref:Bug family tripartite tricarboxylate transporter substrate binding protein n=1 Tax=Cupriavidus consociatus TaxID=2821357 RepID=UPI001AEA29D9|nr:MULTISPECIES: tripartite tricarboxylate transporter substrate binding protein [unclassified Cupriavidus]MBP0618709.1 tripartite tricarboxylate transporter substrate binding protein [Cupriavidus sp. LEh25]MDK2655349.1 tripartite tricarboxylate transporter substrate binding protein [Cupriavidus sp. LEh21]
MASSLRPAPGRRAWLVRGLAGMLAAGSLAVPFTAGAEAWPARPIQLLIPYPPGGSADLLARPVAAKLQEKLGQPVVLDYRPGAGGTIATQALARAKPDGYTLIMVLAAHAINASLYPKLPYDTRKDFAPVSLVANLPMILAGSSSLRANNVQELIAEARANPGKLTFASAGNGNTGHLAGELFDSVAGIKMTHVPYKGSAQVVTAMLSGEVQLTFDSISTTLPHVKSGKLRALAVTGSQRAAVAPDVPTLAEAGVPGISITGWYAVLAPAGTPQPVVDRLSTEIATVLRQPDLKATLATNGYEPVGSTPAALRTHIDAEINRWSKVVKDSGAQIQ